MPRPVHVTLLVENASGWASLCRLITEAHRGTRRAPGSRSALPALPLPSLAIDELERHTEGLVCLSGCARDGAVAGTWERGRSGRRRAISRGGCCAPSGRTTSGSSCSGRSGGTTASRNRWLASLAERLGVPAVATGDAHAHDRSRLRAPGRDGGGAAGRDPRRDRGAAPRQLHLRPALCRAGDGGALPRPPGGGRRDGAARRAPALRPHQRARLQLSGRGGSRSADRRLAELCRVRLDPPLRGDPPPRRGRAAAGRGAGADQEAAALRLLPPPPGHARAGPRGGGRGSRARTRRGGCCRRGAAAARASARSSAT